MNKGLLLDLYELTMAQVYFKYKRNTEGTFDVFIRSWGRPFYIAAGIDEALDYISELKFTKEDIDYLRSLNCFEDDFLEYLKEFKFKGDVWGVEEPEIVFPQEVILRVSANLIEAQILESMLLNKVNLATTLATKAARVVLSAKGKGIYDFSLRRTQGIEASLACAKYSYIAGAKGTSNTYAGLLYKLPVAGTMAHSFVMSFDREIESFLAFARSFPAKSILLVDTYDVKEGIHAAVRIAKFLAKSRFNLIGIRLDSGDISGDAKYARGVLDKEGLIDVSIFASGNLDEYKIAGLIREKAPIDAFGVGTNMGCSSDLPFTDVIYKLVEVKEKNRYFIPTMKLSAGKTTLPSRKQVVRIYNKDGVMEKDVICLEKESYGGKKLLKQLMTKGVRVYKEKDIENKKEILSKKIKALPVYLKELETSCQYPVVISHKLSFLIEGFKDKLKGKISSRSIFMDIDTQYDFLDEKGALYVKDSMSIINNIKRLTNFAYKKGILIISSQDTHEKRDPEFKEFGQHCVRDTYGYKKIKDSLLKEHKVINHKKSYTHKELTCVIKEYPQIILEKSSLNIFSNPNTKELLEVIFPDKVYLYGVVTEYCIKEAAEGLIADFPVVIVQDAIKEISWEEKERLFPLWKSRGIQFITTEELIKQWDKELPSEDKKNSPNKISLPGCTAS